MLITDLNELPKSISLKYSKYFLNGIIFDTCVLFVYFLDKYVTLHPENKYILNHLNISESQILCLNTILKNFGISKIIITPHILAEFLNKIRSEYEEGYKEIKKECLEDLKKFEEIYSHKNELLAHNHFIELGNDVSLILATESHLKQFQFSSIASFDGRFIRKIFSKSDNKILAFDLGTLQYFF